jgi:radical SAM protein with 4Fe4S-binding SPASM domain
MVLIVLAGVAHVAMVLTVLVGVAHVAMVLTVLAGVDNVVMVPAALAGVTMMMTVVAREAVGVEHAVTGLVAQVAVAHAVTVLIVLAVVECVVTVQVAVESNFFGMSLLHQKLTLSPSVVIKKKGDKFLFLNPSEPDWLITNKNGSIALKLCNGKRTIEEIAATLSKISGRDVENEILHFLGDVILKNKIFLSPDVASCNFRPNKLRIVQISLTNECNLKCIYCYASERKERKSRLNRYDFINIIDQISDISKNAQVVLTGGEPLLSRCALEVAEYAKKRGNQVQLLTNGLLIDKKNAKHIAEVFDLIKISVDGSTSEVHEFHRGNGTFDTTSKAIEILLENNAPLQIAMTVTKKNIHDIGCMVNKFGSRLTFAPLFAAGRAKANNKLSISGKEYYYGLSSVDGVNPLSYLCSSLATAKNQKIMKCAIGDAEISISETGDVYPCQLLHFPQFLAGNIQEQSLKEIYDNSLSLHSCRNINVLNINGCQKCDIRFICGGACRARAFYEKNRMDVSGDFCEYEKLAFTNGLFDVHDF